MKKALISLCVIITVMIVYCISSNDNIYSREDMEEAIASAEQRGFDRAYSEAEYGVRATLEQEYREELHSAEAEIEYLQRTSDDAFDAGYQRGYSDCLEEHGWKYTNEYTSSRKKG